MDGGKQAEAAEEDAEEMVTVGQAENEAEAVALAAEAEEDAEEGPTRLMDLAQAAAAAVDEADAESLAVQTEAAERAEAEAVEGAAEEQAVAEAVAEQAEAQAEAEALEQVAAEVEAEVCTVTPRVSHCISRIHQPPLGLPFCHRPPLVPVRRRRHSVPLTSERRFFWWV